MPVNGASHRVEKSRVITKIIICIFIPPHSSTNIRELTQHMNYTFPIKFDSKINSSFEMLRGG